MISDRLLNDLCNIFNNYTEIDRVILFGSRARCDNKNTSDVDLCIFGMDVTHLVLAKVTMDIDELDTPLSFDILNFNELSKKALIDNILNEGVEIYSGKEVR